MKIAFLILALFLPIVAFADPATVEYHATVVSITFLEEVVFSVLFFLVNIVSTIFYDTIGPFQTFLWAYLLFTLFHMFKSMLTARFEDMFLPLFKSLTNNFITKSVLFYVALYTVLTPVSVDMYKLSGPKDFVADYEIKLETIAGNRLKDKNTYDEEKAYHTNVNTLNNERVAGLVMGGVSTSKNQGWQVKNISPWIVAAPINFFQSLIYGTPFMAGSDEIVEGAQIENNYSLMSEVTQYMPEINGIYHEMVKDPAILIDNYIEYFTIVSDMIETKGGFVNPHVKYVDYIIKGFSYKNPWLKNDTFTFVLPESLEKFEAAKEGSEVNPDEVGSSFKKKIVNAAAKKYEDFIIEKSKDIPYRTDVNAVLVKKAIVLEFLSFFGFGDMLKDPVFYTVLNDTIGSTNTQMAFKEGMFVTASQPQLKEAAYKKTILKVASIVLNNEEYYLNTKVTISDNDVNYLYLRLLNQYNDRLNEKYEMRRSTYMQQFTVPTFAHPLSDTYSNLIVNSQLEKRLKNAQPIFREFYKNMSAWVSNSSAKQETVSEIKNSYVNILNLMYEDFDAEDIDDSFPIKESISLASLIDATTKYFNAVSVLNRERRVQFINQNMSKKMFEKFVDTDMYTSSISTFLGVGGDSTGDKTSTLSIPANPLLELKKMDNRSVLEELRLQDEVEESKYHEAYSKKMMEIMDRLSQGVANSSGKGVYMVNRRTEPVWLVWQSSNASIELATVDSANVDIGSDNDSLASSLDEYLYLNVFNRVIQDLYGREDSLLNIRYDSNILHKDSEFLDLNGYDEMSPYAISKISPFLNELTDTDLVDSDGTSILPMSGIPRLAVKKSDNTNSYQPVFLYYADIIQSAANDSKSINNSLGKYDISVIKQVNARNAEYENIKKNAGIAGNGLDSTTMFTFRMFNSEGIPGLINARFQSDIFDLVLGNVEEGYGFFKTLKRVHEKNPEEFKTLLYLDNVDDVANQSIEFTLKKFIDRKTSAEQKKEGFAFSWFYLVSPVTGIIEYGVYKYKDAVKEKVFKAVTAVGHSVKDFVYRFAKGTYSPFLAGIESRENSDVVITIGEYEKMVGAIAAYIAIGAVPYVGDTLQGIIIAIFANIVILIFLVIFLVIMFFSMFKIYLGSIVKGLWGMIMSVILLFKELILEQDIRTALEKTFDAGLKMMYFQILILVLMFGSFLFTSLIRYIINEYYLKDVLFGEFGYIDVLKMTVVFGMFTIAFVKILFFVLSKMTSEDAYSKIEATTGMVGGKVYGAAGSLAAQQADTIGRAANKVADKTSGWAKGAFKNRSKFEEEKEKKKLADQVKREKENTDLLRKIAEILERDSQNGGKVEVTDPNQKLL